MRAASLLPAPALALALAGCAAATAAPPDPDYDLSRGILKELVEINTSQSTGDTHAAAKAMAARLLAAGFPAADVKVFETGPKRGNLVARYRGTGKRKPLMLLAHIDVVEAKREDWSLDPFKLVEKDGHYYGRGTIDDKGNATVWVSNLIRYKREGYKPDRDLVLVLETDEEISDKNGLGITWLLKHQRPLIDAELALNEGGPVAMKDGKPLWNSVQLTEKVFQSFWIETRNSGGHSSQPRADNAIYQLAAALGRIEKLQFPVSLNEPARRFFEKMAVIEAGPVAADLRTLASGKTDAAATERLSAKPPYNAQMRTTCVATRLEGGHADNALPQLARAMINCRMLPGQTPAEVQRTLEAAIADPKVVMIAVARDTAAAPSPVHPELFAIAQELSQKFWPGVQVIPTMGSGATSGRFLRNAGIPTYGHTGIGSELFDNRAHGKDERIGVKAFHDSRQYHYELVKRLAGGS